MTATSFSYARFNARMKKYYVEKGALFEAYDFETPATMLLPKAIDAKGSTWEQPIMDGMLGGGGADYPTTFANSLAPLAQVFSGRWKQHHEIAFIDGDIAATAVGDGTFMDVADNAIKNARTAFRNHIETQIFNSEGGAVGRVSTTQAGGTATVTLTNKTAPLALTLQAGDRLQLAASASGTLRTGGAGEMVVADPIDDVNGTFTIGTFYSGSFTSATAGDYIFREGTNASTEAKKALAGFKSWVPDVAADALSDFKGVARAGSSKLSGIRVSATSLGMRAALTKGAIAGQKHAAQLDVAFISVDNFQELIEELGDQIRYDMLTTYQSFNRPGTAVSVKQAPGATATVGFNTILLQVGTRTIRVCPSIHCNKTLSWLISSTTWKLRSRENPIGSPNTIAAPDGWAPNTGQNQALYPLVSYYELTCGAPGKNVVVTHETEV